MKEEIIKTLNEIKPGVDFEKEKSLVSDGIITSFDLVSLIALLGEKFDVEISVVDLVPENFESVETIEKLIKKLK